MFSLTTYFSTFYWVLLCFFTMASTATLLVTLLNVIRLKNIRLQWNGGKLGGYPLFSTLFILFISCVAAIAYYKTDTSNLDVLIVYGIFSLTWFYTSYYMSTYYLTDHGIVKNVNDPSQTLAWHQVRDFVENEKDGKSKFVFFYLVNKKSYQPGKQEIIRLDIEVPYKYLRSFRRIVSYKLGRRFDYHLSPGTEIRKEFR